MQKTKPASANKLSAWLFHRPLQFTFLTLGVTLLLSLLYGFIMGMFAPESDLMWPLWTLIGLNFVCAIMWLCHKLPSDNLDRRSYIAIFTATNVIMFVLYLATILGALGIIQYMISATIIGVEIMFALCAILIVGVFAMCLGITDLIATYRRVRAMGVSRTVALWSIPFGLCLLAAPAYILPEPGRKRKTITEFGTGAYSRLVEWIATRRGAAFSLMTLGLIITTFVMGVNNSATLGWIGLAFFCVWYVFTRRATQRTIAGAYAKTVAIMNVICIVAAITTITYVATRAPQYDTVATAEVIEITDTENIQ